MKYLACVLVACILSLSAAIAAENEIQLPEPKKTGGPALFEAMDQRGSPGQGSFPSGEVSNEDLSTILWAASGHNRESSNKWTVPMAMGRPPYCKIYVVSKSGAFLYNYKKHTLVRVNDKDVRTLIPLQQFAKDAPATLYLVSDGKALEGLTEPIGSEGGPLLAGAMSQNIYLACGGVGVGARLIYSIKRDEAAKQLKLDAKDTALFAMPIGKN